MSMKRTAAEFDALNERVQNQDTSSLFHHMFGWCKCGLEQSGSDSFFEALESALNYFEERA